MNSIYHISTVEGDYKELMLKTDFIYFVPFMGVASYSIEGINLLFTLRRDFIKHRSVRGFKVLYYSCYFGVLILYVAFGICNYLKFGDKTLKIIFFNYGPEDKLFYVLQILYAIVY